MLSIFAEVGVNPHLYFLVFGESLLNDGVAVVLYKMMKTFAGLEHAGRAVTAADLLLGCCSFLTVAVGGLAVGLVCGLLTSLLTRATRGLRIIEPLALFCGGYLAYVAAELVHWSGIISLIGCGLVQAHYAFRNISAESRITVNYFIKMLSSISDCIIFLYLGMSWFTNTHVWDPGFILWSVLFILVTRFVATYLLCACVNWLRGSIHPISAREMFVMAYGGLRGAVGFSLVITVEPAQVAHSSMLVTTTLVIIMQTVFLQGGSIKWIVNKLRIEKETSGEPSLMVEMNHKLFSHLMAGVECVSGKTGHYYFQDLWTRVDQKYLSKVFCSGDAEHSLERVFDEVSIQDHYMRLYSPALIAADTLREAAGHDNFSFQCDAGQSKVSGDNDQKIEIYGTDSNQYCRISLKDALEQNPFNKLHQVVDKNLSRVAEHDVDHYLLERKRSAVTMRRRLLATPGPRPAEAGAALQRTVSCGPDVEAVRARHQELRRRKTISHKKTSEQEDRSDIESTTGL